MVKRCGYFVQDCKLCRKDVFIEWNKGFDKQAKHAYIEDIIRNLGDDLGITKDVTTASPDYEARSLSPLCVKDKYGNCLEDVWNAVKEELGDLFINGIGDFVYLSNLSSEHVSIALSIDCYIDVFHNPDKAINTQAKWLAVLKLLYEQNRLELLDDMEGFLQWYDEYAAVHVV